MRPVVRLEAVILQVREVAAGDGAGYGAHWTAPGPRRLATIALGYADGYPRAAGGTDAKDPRGRSGGRRAGRAACAAPSPACCRWISPSSTSPTPPAAAAARGGTAVMIGDGLEIDEVGMRAGTIGYEILTNLGPRYPGASTSATGRATGRATEGAAEMAKRSASFICQNCGAVYNRWKGKCEACGEWNSVVEETSDAPPTNRPVALQARPQGPGVSAWRASPARRGSRRARRRAWPSSNRVTGGGFVRGSVILIGGDPGIGKSTMLMQASAALARSGERVAYISGEEAVGQVRLRAERLGLSDAPVELAAQTNVEDIVATLSQGRIPALAVIDSIQTMWTETVESAPGTVTQVRASAQALIRFAKTTGAAVILVGHVTKDGQIAGPRVVEHMVDAVVSFEGDNAHHFRIPARGEEPLRPHRRDRRLRDDREGPLGSG